MFKRTILALCLMAVCWMPSRADALPGDVNGNGKTDIGDITALIDYLLGQGTTTIDLEVADVDGDGQVSIADVVGLVDLILEAASTPGYDDDPDWVDLGLPSGTIWATRNVGASSPEDYGYYFAWGETEPKEVYNRNTYKWGYYDSKGNWRWTKYYYSYYDYTSQSTIAGDNKTELDLSDDAACAHYPGGRMPSLEQIQELVNSCTWQWIQRNGVIGRLATGPNGNTMFLPAAGYRWDSSLYDAGSRGYYWSRTLDSSDSYFACRLYFNSGGVDWYYYYRYGGFSVRAVRVS